MFIASINSIPLFIPKKKIVFITLIIHDLISIIIVKLKKTNKQKKTHLEMLFMRRLMPETVWVWSIGHFD